MTHFSDDLYLGGFFGTQGFSRFSTVGTIAQPDGNPTNQIGIGPAGRVFFHTITPLALATNNLRASAVIASTTLALAAGTGITLGTAPDGSGLPVYVLDTARCVSLTSASNLSALTITIVGYDIFGRKQTQALAGPNANTVNTLKAFQSVLSATSSATSANSIAIGTSDIFGLPFLCYTAAYIVRAGWDSTLAANAGTFVPPDLTSPATSTTGDTRGTYAQAGNPSNGTRVLVLGWHMDGTQCGAQPSVVNAIGVQPA